MPPLRVPVLAAEPVVDVSARSLFPFVGLSQPFLDGYEEVQAANSPDLSAVGPAVDNFTVESPYSSNAVLSWVVTQVPQLSVSSTPPAAVVAPSFAPPPRPPQKLDGVERFGPGGTRVGTVEKLPRGGVIVYTSAGWVQLAVPMWSNRDTLLRYVMQGGFKPQGVEGYVPSEMIPHIIPTVCLFDLDYTPETTGLYSGDFEQYLFFVARGTRFRFVMPDAAIAGRARDYLESSYRGPQGVDLKKRMRAEHGSDPQGVPNLAAEQAVFAKSSPASICDIDHMVDGEFRVSENVTIRKPAPQLYEVYDHGELVARIDLTDPAWAMPQTRLTPDLELHKDTEFLDLRRRALIDGEAMVWPLGTSDGFSLGKDEATAGHMLWNNGRCTLVDPTSDVVERFLTQGIPLESIEGVIITHGHGDHFSDGVAQLLRILPQIKIFTTRTIYEHISGMYKAAVGGRREGLQQWNFVEVKPRQFMTINGLNVRFHYTCHTVPTIAYEIRTTPDIRSDNLVFYYSGDTLAERDQLLDKFMAPESDPDGLESLLATDADGDFVMSVERLDEIMRPFRLLDDTWKQEPPPMICIEGGMPGIHTPFDKTLERLKEYAARMGVAYEDVMRRVRLYHMADGKIQGEDAAYKWKAGHLGVISFARHLRTSQTQAERIQHWLAQTPLLAEASKTTRKRLAAKAELIDVDAGAELTEGYIYIPVAGAFAASQGESAVIQPFGVIGAADVFSPDASGEVSRMRALVASQALRIPLRDAREILGSHPAAREKLQLRTDWQSFVENVRLATPAVEISRMRHLPQSVLAPLFMCATQRHFVDGEAIVNEGQMDDRNHQDIFLVVGGQVRIQRRDSSLDVKSGRGEIFGEMSFVLNRPRSATVTASGPVTVLRFSAAKLRQLMKHYPGIWIALSRLAAAR